jgi:uncharacterized coiled-coil protein SlyX
MMKKLTELQVLKALDILNFPDIPENRADLQRVSKELQYDTTSTERPCVGYPDCDGDLPGEEHSTGCLAAHNLAERAMSAFLQADHLRPEEAGRSRKAVDAVICLVQQDSNARWEKALRDHPGPAISEQAIEWVRARIEANPKTLEERIAELEHQLAEEKKDFDALDDQYHRLGEKYEEIQKIAPQSNKENSMPVGKPGRG